MLLRPATLAALLALIPLSCTSRTESELAGTAAHFGLDYDAIKARAHRDPEGLRGFFILGMITDGAASEEYSDQIAKLLEFWGESAFMRALEPTGGRIRRQVLDALAYESCYRENEPFWVKFSADYPRIAAWIVREKSEGPATY